MRCMMSTSRSSPSKTTATGFPRRGTSVNTSTCLNGKARMRLLEVDVRHGVASAEGERVDGDVTRELRMERGADDVGLLHEDRFPAERGEHADLRADGHDARRSDEDERPPTVVGA